MAAAEDAFGPVSVLVNNAGIVRFGQIEETEPAVWRQVLEINLTGAYLGIRAVVSSMRKAGGGAIVNISSGAGRRGLPYRIGYCSAKAGQVGMAYGLALELGPQGIRVNVVAPGAVEGDRIDRVIAGQAQVRGVSEEAMRRSMLERSPLKRMTTAGDITEAALFLASDLAKNISGQVLAVNAGEPAG